MGLFNLFKKRISRDELDSSTLLLQDSILFYAQEFVDNGVFEVYNHHEVTLEIKEEIKALFESMAVSYERLSRLSDDKNANLNYYKKVINVTASYIEAYHKFNRILLKNKNKEVKE
jgi:hypothetical protein